MTEALMTEVSLLKYRCILLLLAQCPLTAVWLNQPYIPHPKYPKGGLLVGNLDHPSAASKRFVK